MSLLLLKCLSDILFLIVRSLILNKWLSKLLYQLTETLKKNIQRGDSINIVWKKEGMKEWGMFRLCPWQRLGSLVAHLVLGHSPCSFLSVVKGKWCKWLFTGHEFMSQCSGADSMAGTEKPVREWHLSLKSRLRPSQWPQNNAFLRFLLCLCSQPQIGHPESLLFDTVCSSSSFIKRWPLKSIISQIVCCASLKSQYGLV